MLGDHHPGPHPGVEIAVDPDDLRLLEGDGNGPSLGLGPVEGRVLRADAVQVVEQPIAVEELHRPPHRNDHHARHVDALLLVHLHGAGWGLPADSGRGRLERDDRPANAAVGTEDEILALPALAAHVLVDVDGHGLFFRRRPRVEHGALYGSGHGGPDGQGAPSHDERDDADQAARGTSHTRSPSQLLVRSTSGCGEST